VLHLQELQNGGTIICDCDIADVVHQHLQKDEIVIKVHKQHVCRPARCLLLPCPAPQGPDWCGLCWLQR
jgi:hypothetical protein